MGSYTAPASRFTGGTVASATTFSSLVTASAGVLDTWLLTTAIPVVTQTATITPGSCSTLYRRSLISGTSNAYLVEFTASFQAGGNGTATGPIIIDIATLIAVFASSAGYVMSNVYAQTINGSFAGKPCLVQTMGSSTLSPLTNAGVNLGTTQTLASSDSISLSGLIAISLD